jgi:hypothetical protein
MGERARRVREAEERRGDQERDGEKIVERAMDTGVEYLQHRSTSKSATGNGHCSQEGAMLKVLGWIVLIIFLIGLLVVIGVFDFIF